MKNIRKRFLSLVMAMMMILGCMATASAADVADTTSASGGYEITLNTPNDNGSISPRYVETLIGPVGFVNTGGTAQFPITIAEESYLIFGMQSDTDLIVRLTKDGTTYCLQSLQRSSDSIARYTLIPFGSHGVGKFAPGKYTFEVTYVDANKFTAYYLMASSTLG